MKTKVRLFLLSCLAILGICFFAGMVQQSFANNEWWFYYEDFQGKNFQHGEGETAIGKIIKEDAVQPQEWLLQRLMGVFKLDTPEYNWPLKALYYLKKLINYALTFVSFIAFLIVLYTFYMMLIGDGEKGREKAKSTLKTIAIAIVLMGVSWSIVSLIFYIYQQQIL